MKNLTKENIFKIKLLDLIFILKRELKLIKGLEHFKGINVIDFYSETTLIPQNSIKKYSKWLKIGGKSPHSIYDILTIMGQTKIEVERKLIDCCYKLQNDDKPLHGIKYDYFTMMF